MSEVVNCSFARVALRTIVQKNFMHVGTKKIAKKIQLEKVANEYNKLFSEYPEMILSQSKVLRKTSTVLSTFNKRWHPTTMKKLYLQAFSIDQWNTLDVTIKSTHHVHNCKACLSTHPSLHRAFPCAANAGRPKNAVITLDAIQLSSPESCVEGVLSQLDSISQERFGESAQAIICKTQHLRMMAVPSRSEKRKEQRKIVQKTRAVIQKAMDDTTLQTVMGHRTSWRKYDLVRKEEGLSNVRKRKNSSQDQPTVKKRIHGHSMDSLTIETVQLLDEARTWSADQKVNWSELARKYGLHQKNGGQTIKEFLAANGVPLATKTMVSRRDRRKSKKLPGGISFPMKKPSSYHKKSISQLVETGQILMGKEVVEEVHTTFSVSKDPVPKVVEKLSKSYSRQVRLFDIRKKMLALHEEQGLVRNSSDEYIDGLTDSEVRKRLEAIGEHHQESDGTELREKLKKVSRQRMLKVWHDHSTVSGHGLILVLVSGMYDPAFYHTPDEMKSKTGKVIDVQGIVECPELHIIGRSTSTLKDQLKYVECRKQCMLEMGAPISLANGVVVTDIVRFFHGDGPAQQFEAGHSIGGNYCCVGCGAHSSCFDDVVHSCRSEKHNLQSRQNFVIKGHAWKKGVMSPFDKLTVRELKMELEVHGVSIMHKKKERLEEDLEDLRKGIVNVPALLRTNPEMPLESLFLAQYEVCPIEPLHDLKGHFSNMIEETMYLAPEEALPELHKIKNAVLNKDTLRGSDYRKAVILMFKKLEEICPGSMLTKIYETAVHICKLLYAPDTKRSPKTVLCLHNLAFLHGILFTQIFANPKRLTRRKVFGRYFHAITTHSPLVYRIVCPRSINTEQHERVFGQIKQITKETSNQSPNHIITNIMQRLYFEEKNRQVNPIAIQESEIERLAATVGPIPNTCFSIDFITTHSSAYQAHLERIGDYLLQGPGVWWKTTTTGIQFLDGESEKEHSASGPALMHFRSTSLSDIDLVLLDSWERCITVKVQLPAVRIQTYMQGDDGNIQNNLLELTESTFTATPTITDTSATVSTFTATPTISATESTFTATPTISATETTFTATPTISATETTFTAAPTISATGTTFTATPTISATGTTFTATPTITATVSTFTATTVITTATPTITATCTPATDITFNPTNDAHSYTHECSKESTLVTSVGKLLSEIHSNDCDILVFDGLRAKLKSTKSCSDKEKEEYRKLVSNIKKKTICRLLEAEKTVQLFVKNNPHLSNYPSNIAKEQRICFVAKEILVHEWKCKTLPTCM